METDPSQWFAPERVTALIRPPGEAAVPHVERRDQHLEILDRLDGQHAYAGGRAGRAEPGDAVDAAQVDGAGSVDLQAVEPVGLPGDRDPGVAAHHGLRGEQHQLGEVPVGERECARPARR